MATSGDLLLKNVDNTPEIGENELTAHPKMGGRLTNYNPTITGITRSTFSRLTKETIGNLEARNKHARDRDGARSTPLASL